MQGDRQGALEIGESLGAQPWRWQGKTLWQARVAVALGDVDEATGLLRETVNEGLEVTSFHFQMRLLTRALQDYPPFQELVRPKG